MKLVFLDNHEKTTIGETTILDKDRRVTMEYAGASFSAARHVPATDTEPEYFIYRLLAK